MLSSKDVNDRLTKLTASNSHFVKENEARLLLRRKREPTVCLSILPDERFERASIVHKILADKIADCISIGAKCIILFLDYTAHNAKNSSAEVVDKITRENEKFFRALLGEKAFSSIVFEYESQLIKKYDRLDLYYRDFYRLVANSTLSDLLPSGSPQAKPIELILPFLDLLTIKLVDADIIITSEHLKSLWSLCENLSMKVFSVQPPAFLVTPTIPSLDGKTSHLDSDLSLIMYIDEKEERNIEGKVATATDIVLSILYPLLKHKGDNSSPDCSIKEKVLDAYSTICSEFNQKMNNLNETSDPLNELPLKISPYEIETIKALNCETRLRILQEIARGTTHGYGIARNLKQSASNIWTHLEILEKANLIKSISFDIDSNRKEYKLISKRILLEYDLLSMHKTKVDQGSIVKSREKAADTSH